MVVYFAGTLTQWLPLMILGIVLLVIPLLRMFSRNGEKRRKENAVLLRAKRKITSYFRRIKKQYQQRKTHRFYHCPSCKQILRVPKGKGRLKIKCPKCGTAFEKKT
jgi:predicted RNA-binding Zn-ribbon protein involved in translation (DUF1610 family)